MMKKKRINLHIPWIIHTCMLLLTYVCLQNFSLISISCMKVKKRSRKIRHCSMMMTRWMSLFISVWDEKPYYKKISFEHKFFCVFVCATQSNDKVKGISNYLMNVIYCNNDFLFGVIMYAYDKNTHTHKTQEFSIIANWTFHLFYQFSMNFLHSLRHKVPTLWCNIWKLILHIHISTDSSWNWNLIFGMMMQQEMSF